MLYELGQGVEQNYIHAVTWTEKAAKQGNAMAACNLAWYYTNDIVLEKDLSEAAIWFHKSGQKDHKQAQSRLVTIHKDGIGTNKSLTWATYWLLRYSLSDDRKKLTISLKDALDLLELIPNGIIAFSDFKDVSTIEFTKCPDEAKNKLYPVLIQMIQSKATFSRLIAFNGEFNIEVEL